jgi:IPT/TIG domain
VAGLPAGEAFRVRLVVASNDATDYSDLITFATAPTPPVVPVSPVSDLGTLFGCAAPHLNAYDAKPKLGETITITGSDLGVGATVVLGDQSLTPADWSTTGFTIQLPDDATGTLPLTVNCGRVSNTVAVAVFHEPANAFLVTKRSVAGLVATLSVRVPGPGKLETSGSRIKATKATVTKAAAITVKVRLTSAAIKALGKAKSRTLKVAVVARFTPAGGQSASKAVALTFKRQAGR